MAKDKPKSVLPFSAPTHWLLWLMATVVLMGMMLFLFFTYPRGAIGPKQPVPFSHRVHAGVKRIDCLFCHPYASRSRKAGLPALKKCFFCHNYVIPHHPEIEKERRHVEAHDPVRWVRIFYVPDFVKFRHHPHISWAGLNCDTCHGPVEQMDRLQQRAFKMGFCIDCHRRMGAQLECWLTCHR
jgi:hypothetical protein